MHFVRTGHGKVLLLQHGFLGGSAYWRPQLAAFRPHFKVFAPDLPGFAGSGHLNAPASMKGFADALIGFLDEQRVDELLLLGHSMGGMIAQEVAVAIPHRVRRLVLYGTACSGDLPGRFETCERTRERLTTEGLERVRLGVAASWFVEGEAHPHFETCDVAGRGVTEPAAINALAAISSWRFESEVSLIRAPTLVICGDQDRSTNVAESTRLWKSIPKARLCVVPGCAHNVHLERTDVFNRIVLDFLLEDG